MPKAATFSNDLLALILNGTTLASLFSAAGSATLLYLSLHTANPGTTSDQTTSEIAYTTYARVSVARTTSGFTAPSAGSSALVANADFPVMTAGAGGTATYAGLGTGSSGVGKMLYTGLLTPSISVVNGTIPRLTTGTTVAEA